MRRLMAIGAAAVVGAILFMGAPAFAATTGYPPPTTVPVTPPSLSAICPIGSTVTVTYSGFLPGSPFQIVIAGQLAASGTVGANGTITVSIACTDPHMSVNGGTLIAVPFGTSSVTAQGTGANSAPFSEVASVTIPSATSTAAVGGSTTGSSSSGGSLAFTGAEIGGMVAGGLILLGAGGALVLATRRRAHTS